MADDFEQYKRQGEDFSQYKRTPSAPTSGWDQVKQVGSSLGSKISDLGKSAVSGVQDIANSNDPLTEIANKAGGMASGIVQPMYDSLDRYKASAGKLVHGDTSQILPTVQHAIGAAVPFAGPADAAMEQAVQEKQKTGSVSPNTIADVTLQGVAPIVAPSIARGVGGIATEAPAAVSAVGEKLAQTTPKQVAQTVGGVAGAGLGHGSLSIPGAYYGVKGAGGVAEGILGKDVANSPIFGEKPVYPGAKLPARPDAKFLKQNIATPMQEGSSVLPVKTPSGLNAENAAHSNSFFEQVKAEHPEMSVSQQLMEAAKRENAPTKGIPGKPTVIPASSSEAYKSATPPLEARIPGPNEDMTALLSKSVDKVKAPVYDDETIAAAAKGLEEQGYDPKHIQQVLQKMGLGPKTGMNVDEVFSQYPPGDTVQPFGKERAAAIEAQGPEADAIKSKLTTLRNVKVPPSPAMTPEEIKTRLLKFQR